MFASTTLNVGIVGLSSSVIPTWWSNARDQINQILIKIRFIKIAVSTTPENVCQDMAGNYVHNPCLQPPNNQCEHIHNNRYIKRCNCLFDL